MLKIVVRGNKNTNKVIFHQTFYVLKVFLMILKTSKKWQSCRKYLKSKNTSKTALLNGVLK